MAAKKMKMPHPEHEEHLCFLENTSYLKSPELLEIGVDRREEYRRLVREENSFAGNATGQPRIRKTSVNARNCNFGKLQSY
jgi:hypothetical protein